MGAALAAWARTCISWCASAAGSAAALAPFAPRAPITRIGTGPAPHLRAAAASTAAALRIGLAGATSTAAARAFTPSAPSAPRATRRTATCTHTTSTATRLTLLIELARRALSGSAARTIVGPRAALANLSLGAAHAALHFTGWVRGIAVAIGRRGARRPDSVHALFDAIAARATAEALRTSTDGRVVVVAVHRERNTVFVAIVGVGNIHIGRRVDARIGGRPRVSAHSSGRARREAREERQEESEGRERSALS